MMDAYPQSTPPTTGPMEAAGPKEKYTVCIECYDDGTFRVGKDTPEAEAAEGAAPEMMAPEATEDSGYQPAATADEALALAKQILSPMATAASTGGSGQAGFDKGRGMPFQRGGM